VFAECPCVSVMCVLDVWVFVVYVFCIFVCLVRLICFVYMSTSVCASFFLRLCVYVYVCCFVLCVCVFYICFV